MIFWVFQGEYEVIYFALIRLISEVKYGDDPKSYEVIYFALIRLISEVKYGDDPKSIVM